MSRDLLVVGGGMAGLTLATARVAAGDCVTVVDKGRRHGGRMATRRIDDATYDTGAASFAVHGATMRAAVDRWVAAGHAATVDGDGRRVRGVPTMRSLPTALATASGADVRIATTVTGLDVQGGRWAVTVEEGGEAPRRSVLTADALAITIPAPQAVALLSGSSVPERTRPSGPALASAATLAHLDSVVYDPCLAVLVRPRGGDGTVGPHTIHAHPQFSAEHLDGDRQAAARTLADTASERLGVALEVVHVHGWRYAQATRGIPEPALRDDTAGPPLLLAGDLFEASEHASTAVRAEGVERAFLSGHSAATLLER